MLWRRLSNVFLNIRMLVLLACLWILSMKSHPWYSFSMAFRIRCAVAEICHLFRIVSTVQLLTNILLSFFQHRSVENVCFSNFVLCLVILNAKNIWAVLQSLGCTSQVGGFNFLLFSKLAKVVYSISHIDSLCFSEADKSLVPYGYCPLRTHTQFGYSIWPSCYPHFPNWNFKSPSLLNRSIS